MITMYSTTWCGYCRRLKSAFDREGVLYKEVNIEEDPEAAAFVMGVNGGNATVPTLQFEDGSRAHQSLSRTGEGEARRLTCATYRDYGHV